MKLKDLFEYEKRGETVYETEHAILYHMTDYVGLTNAIKNNALTALRQSFISTTYNPHMNGVVGRMHYAFKFVLDGKKLAEDYGVFENRAFANVVGSGKYVDLDEDELGINTKSISPLSNYCNTLIILDNIFSRTFAQWLFYKKYNDQGRGIAAIKAWVKSGRKLLVLDGEPRPLNEKEKEYLSYAIKLYNSPNISYSTALERLSNKFQIIDQRDVMDDQQVSRERKTERVLAILHRTLTKKPYIKITPLDVKNMMSNILDILSYGSNYKSEIMHQIESKGLFDGMVEPVRWSLIIKDLIKGKNIDDICDDLDYIKDELDRKKSFYVGRDDDDYMLMSLAKQKHSQTGLAGIGDGE